MNSQEFFMSKKTSEEKLPQARTEDLAIQEVEDEVLVYDLKRDKAHCLNRSIARIWRLCDGKTSVSAIKEIVEKEWNTPLDEAVIWTALAQLEKAHLLQEKIARPKEQPKLSRRDLARKMGLAAVLVPFITTILAPTPAQAATCLEKNSLCKSNSQCCSGICSKGLCR